MMYPSSILITLTDFQLITFLSVCLSVTLMINIIKSVCMFICTDYLDQFRGFGVKAASIFTHYNPMILTGHLMIINSFSLSVCSSVRITLVNLGIWGEGSILLWCFDEIIPWYMLPWGRDVKAWEKVSLGFMI